MNKSNIITLSKSIIGLCLLLIVSCKSNVGSSSNNIMTNEYCHSINAGDGIKIYNKNGVLSNKKYSYVETCSNWVTNESNNVNKNIKLKATSDVYDFNINTVLNYGQTGATWLLFESNNIFDVESIYTSGVGAYNYSQAVTYSDIIPTGILTTNLSNLPEFLNSSTDFAPFGPSSYNGVYTNFPDAANQRSGQTIAMPQICDGDSRYNVSGTINLLMEINNIAVLYPVSYLTYCSWNGTTIGNYGSYSTAIQLFGGITENQIFDSNTNLNVCSYVAINPNKANSNTSMNCNLGSTNTNVNFNLQEQFANLVFQFRSGSFYCYLSSDSPAGLLTTCSQNGWTLNASFY